MFRIAFLIDTTARYWRRSNYSKQGNFTFRADPMTIWIAIGCRNASNCSIMLHSAVSVSPIICHLWVLVFRYNSANSAFTIMEIHYAASQRNF